MAMQRASPTRMRPCMNSGRSWRKISARANISTGPISQFWTRDRPRTFQSLKTRCISS